VRSETVGTPRPLSAGTDLAAYRIVQEALTNVHRHAAATTAQVRLEYTDDALVITVDDDGQGTFEDNADGSGAGIAGMRERATALGGSLEAGRRLAGGFRVRATLPTP
jgi:signal transduction histidine kinase